MRVIEKAESPLHAQMQRTFNNTFWEPKAEAMLITANFLAIPANFCQFWRQHQHSD